MNKVVVSANPRFHRAVGFAVRAVKRQTVRPLDEATGEPDRARVEAHRDTTIFVGCPDVDAAFEHLKSLGITAEPPRVTH